MKKSSSTGIQSIEVGIPLLVAFLRGPEAMPLSVVAKAAGMTSSKAHKYLVSFIRSGLVIQDSRNGNYRLGPLALELGLTALRHLTAFDIAEGAMHELRDRLELTVSLTVWANQGPTVVRRLETRGLQFVTVRVGSVLPLLTSANGRIFLAYLDRHHTQASIDAELASPSGAAARHGLRGIRDVEALIAKVRAERLAEIDGFMAGMAAVSAPIFDASDALCAGLTIVGPREADARKGSAALLATADELSRQLGASHAMQPKFAPRRGLRRAG